MSARLITRTLALSLATLSTACNCSSKAATSKADTPKHRTDTMLIESSAFKAGESIPTKYTCEGEDVSPPLSWSGLPEGTRSLVLIVDDPDAPDPKAPKTTWVHWVLYDIPADASGLPEGVSSDKLPPGTRQGLNDWKRPGYGGPCPPIGEHRYFHKIYALDKQIGELGTANKAAVEGAMKGHVLASGELIGTYKKHE